MLHECKRCGYASDRKGNLINHLKATKTCKPTKCNANRQDLLSELQATPVKHNMKCDVCKKEFYHKSQLQKHECIQEITSVTTVNNSHLEQLVMQQNRTIDALTQKIIAIETIVNNALFLHPKRHLKISQQVEEIHSDNAISISCEDITINCFRRECIDYITDSYMIQLLQTRSQEDAIRNMIDYMCLVHMNPLHPENHNIYVPHRGISFIKMESGWIHQTLQKTVQALINVFLSNIMDFIDSHEDDGIIDDDMASRWCEMYEDADRNVAIAAKMRACVIDRLLTDKLIVCKSALNEIRRCGKEMSKLMN